MRNEESISITCIAFHLIKKDSILFADKEGYIGSFDNVLSANKSAGNLTSEDPLMEVSISLFSNNTNIHWLIKCAYFLYFAYG